MTMPNMKELMQKAQEMQKKMQWTQQKLASIEVRGEAGAGMVIVVMNGRHETTKVIIDSSLLKENKEMLEDLIRIANNDAARKIEEVLKIEMAKLTKDLGIPAEGGQGGQGTQSGQIGEGGQGGGVPA